MTIEQQNLMTWDLLVAVLVEEEYLILYKSSLINKQSLKPEILLSNIQ